MSGSVDNLAQYSLLELKRRNESQSAPFRDMCDGYAKLWNENKILQQQHLEMRRQIVVIQREVADLSTLPAEESTVAVESLRKTLNQLQVNLKDKTEEDYAKKIKADLGRKVSEQNKLILDLQEEVRIAKTELTSCREQISIVTKELECSKLSETAVTNELNNIRSIYSTSEAAARKLTVENAVLVERLVKDKQTMMEELNKMNSKSESNSATNSFFSIFGAATAAIAGTNVSEPQQTVKQTLASESRSRSVTVEKIRDDYLSVEEEQSDSMMSNRGIPTTPWKSVQCTTSTGEAVEVNAIDTLYNDRYIAVGGSDSTVRVYDIGQYDYSAKGLSTLKPTPIIQFDVKNAPILSLSSKGGEFIIAGYGDKSCRIWSMRSPTMITQLSGHNAKITGVKWVGSSSGFGARGGTGKITCHEQAISVSTDRSIRLWDVANSRATVTIQGDSAITCMDICSDGNSCVTGHQNGKIQFWDLSAGRCIKEVVHHAAPITSVSFGAQGDYSKVLACSKDNSCSVVDCYTYKPFQTLRSPTFRVTCDWSKASFCYHSNSRVVAGSADGSICIWDVDQGSVTSTLDSRIHNSPVIVAQWNRFGLLSSDRAGKVILWR